MKLSLQALETLAVIAYKQPVTAPEVSEIRGVDSAGVLGCLLGRKLITTAGRKQVIGRPILYKTTKEFLLRFGLKDVNELPSMEEFEKMAGELNDIDGPVEADEAAPELPLGESADSGAEPGAEQAELGRRNLIRRFRRTRKPPIPSKPNAAEPGLAVERAHHFHGGPHAEADAAGDAPDGFAGEPAETREAPQAAQPQTPPTVGLDNSRPRARRKRRLKTPTPSKSPPPTMSASPSLRPPAIPPRSSDGRASPRSPRPARPPRTQRAAPAEDHRRRRHRLPPQSRRADPRRPRPGQRPDRHRAGHQGRSATRTTSASTASCSRAPERHRYFMLNKPKGYVTTVSDPEGRPTVMEFFKASGVRVYPVGRLDYQSEGLLLMTNDGELANKLTRAAAGVEKTYLVKVSGKPSEAALNQLRAGIMIDRGRKSADSGEGRVMTQPARIRLVRDADNPWYEVILTEGRNREIRKMFEEIGHFVEKIRRVGYGPLVLDIAPGRSPRALRRRSRRPRTRRPRLPPPQGHPTRG